MSYVWGVFQTILPPTGLQHGFRGRLGQSYGENDRLMQTAPLHPCAGPLGFLGPSLNARVSYQHPCAQIRLADFWPAQKRCAIALASKRVAQHCEWLDSTGEHGLVLCFSWFRLAKASVLTAIYKSCKTRAVCQRVILLVQLLPELG